MTENKAIKGIFDCETLFPHIPDSSSLVLVCSREDYSASQICRAVEDCDAHLLNLNVTSSPEAPGQLAVYIRVNVRNPDPVVRSIERFGYIVTSVSAPEQSGQIAEARDRVNQLLHYLEL